jgi:hypothetical protein
MQGAYYAPYIIFMVSGVPLEHEGLVPKQELGNQD